MLYNVHYTNQRIAFFLDAAGNDAGKTITDVPVTHTALPITAAMSYSGCDNFSLEPFSFDEKSNAAPRKTKMRAEQDFEPAEPIEPEIIETHEAARTGDLSAAVY